MKNIFHITIILFVRAGKSRLQAEYGQGVLEAGLFDLYGCYPFTDQLPRLPPLPSNKGADDARMAGTDPGITPTRRHFLTDSASMGAGKIWTGNSFRGSLLYLLSYSHFYEGSMYGDMRLRVARSYTSSADSPFSLMSFFYVQPSSLRFSSLPSPLYFHYHRPLSYSVFLSSHPTPIPLHPPFLDFLWVIYALSISYNSM